MERHKLTHAPPEVKEGKMFQCTDCTYKTLQESNLKAHQNTHTGERPNECPFPGCTFRTAHPSSLSRHRSRKHGHRPEGSSEGPPPANAERTTRRRSRSSPYSQSTPASSSAELIAKRVRICDARRARNSLPDHASLPSNSGTLTTLEAPVAEYPHPHPQCPSFEQVGLYTLDTGARSFRNAVLDDFNASFNDWLPEVTPVNGGLSLPFPLV
ncbi:hypothetical protein V8E55_007516 [Tylopilus felleus]